MVDTHDQNQVGPPVMAVATADAPVSIAAPTNTMADIATTPTSVANTIPTADDGERLYRVRALVDALADLTNVIREIDDRSRTVERDRREGRETEAPEATLIWKSALEPLAQYLSQPIQLTVGSHPIQLADAADQLAAWVSTWRENAVGPGGQGLQEDERRLELFEQRLTGIDPAPEWLEQEGQRLLSRPELDPETVHRTVLATQQSLADEQDRQAAIDETMLSLAGEWEAGITPLEERLRVLRASLLELKSESNISEALKTKAQDGIHHIDAINLEELVRKRVSLGAWVDKYRADREFTSDQIRDQINHELRPALRQTESAIEQVEQQFAPNHLRTEAQANSARRAKVIRDAIDKLLDDARNRYQILVGLRRTKLGQEPDDRFFGEIAKQVNTAITELGNLEADLLRTQSSITEQQLLDHTELDRLRKRTADTLRHSTDFATPAALEKLLTKQAQIQQAKEHELAKAEAERTAEAKRAVAQAQAKENEAQQKQQQTRAQQEQVEAEKKRESELEQTNQRLRAEQQTLSQELANYLNQLQSIEQEQQRRTAALESLITAERKLLVDDQQKLLENRTERRAMTATEAENWLKTLAETKHSLEQRQFHLDQLTKELLSIQTIPKTTTHITSLQQRLAESAPTTPTTEPTNPPKAIDPNTPIHINIARHS